jgi:hypothetical protein
MDIKVIKVDKVYDVEYKWGTEWRKGWGRLNSEGYVNVITSGSGVSNVPLDENIKFIKLTNV